MEEVEENTEQNDISIVNDENIPSGKDFAIINDKIRLAADIIKMEWCPTMDLIAVLSSENVIHVHRFLTWQKLYTITNDDTKIKFTSFSWRPDGKVMAVGSEDGAIQLYNIENGELIHKNSTMHNASITCIQWVQEQNVTTHVKLIILTGN
jgi:WD40 repeat protein